MASMATELERSGKYHLAASIAVAIVLPVLFVGSVLLFSLSWIGPTVFWCLRLTMAILAAAIAFAYSQSGNRSKVSRWLAIALAISATLAVK